MQITLKNIGCINEATVNLTGLNVIAGENGTGKSTVGKTVYTVIKSISDCDTIAYEYMKNIVEKVFGSIYFSIQNNLMNQKSDDSNIKVLLDSFNLSFVSTFLELLYGRQYEKVKELIYNNIAYVDSSNSLDDKSKSLVEESLNNVIRLFDGIFNNVDKKNAIEQSLIFMYHRMFKLQVNNLKNHNESEIYFDNNGRSLKYHVSNNTDTLEFSNRLNVISVDSNLKQGIFPKVTFIETCLVLQLANSNNLPFHWEDLINKLKSDTYTIESSFGKQIYEDLSNILGGELIYDTNKQDFHFVSKGTDNKLQVNNMASGEKMFAILQKMAKLGFLSPDHLLIFDEPENHLHPQWQVILAKIFITLIENNIPILLTTHSATLINALQEFAESKKLLHKTKFYFADKKDMTIKNIDMINNDGKDIIFESFYKAKEFLPEL
jgi:predicted ATP-dependent endonuclease of OLD family